MSLCQRKNSKIPKIRTTLNCTGCHSHNSKFNSPASIIKLKKNKNSPSATRTQTPQTSNDKNRVFKIYLLFILKTIRSEERAYYLGGSYASNRPQYNLIDGHLKIATLGSSHIIKLKLKKFSLILLNEILTTKSNTSA